MHIFKEKTDLPQHNVDGTPNLQDRTTIWDLGVKKSIKKRGVSFKMHQPLASVTIFSIKHRDNVQKQYKTACWAASSSICRRNSFSGRWNSLREACSAHSFFFLDQCQSTQGMASGQVHCTSHQNAYIQRVNSFASKQCRWNSQPARQNSRLGLRG